MYRGQTVGIVVPAYNEEALIGKTLATMPDYVDQVFVVEDGSGDRTGEVIREHQARDARIVLIQHPDNQGLGQSLVDGYLASRAAEMDITAVMAGDAQMHPDDLPGILDPIAEGWADYTKGNRLLRDEVAFSMPRYRYIGNAALTLLTKFATGYWHIIDPQCGYTAISRKALATIPIHEMIKGYGYNAHILNMLNLNNFRVCDVGITPVYGDEQSGIRLRSYVPKVSRLLAGLFVRRMVHKYLVREFNPLIFFYIFSFINVVGIGGPFTVRFFYLFNKIGLAPATTLIILTFSMSMGLFSFFFAMWMDMEDNRKLIALSPAPT